VRDSLYIAWRYLSFYRMRTGTLIAVVALIATIPAALAILSAEAERQLTARAAATPLLVGAPGSALDLTMNALYFRLQPPNLLAMAEADDIDASGLAYAIPLYVRFHARGAPIVGTAIDYFKLRGLRLARGRPFAVLGEAVLGSEAARRLGAGAGGAIVSSPENPFDLAGSYPLKMPVVGVLAPTGTPDDRAVFVDVRTTWIIEGLGHGHEDLARVRDSSVLLKREGGELVANAKLMQYAEIDRDNIDSFHFHGPQGGFPLTGAIAVARDGRAETILRGRYEDTAARAQAVKPAGVMAGVIDDIFRVRDLIAGIVALVAAATVLALALVFNLSLRLREREMEVLFHIGAQRLTAVRLVAAEIALLLTAGLALAAIVSAALSVYRQPLVQWLALQ